MATAYAYGNFLKCALNKEIDWDTDVIKVALITNATAPNQDTHIYFDTAGYTEVTGTGYSAGGATLANKTITYTAGTNIIKLDADDVIWSNSTISAYFAVIYDSSPASNKPLLGYIDFGGVQASSSGNFTITWDAGGIFNITAS